MILRRTMASAAIRMITPAAIRMYFKTGSIESSDADVDAALPGAGAEVVVTDVAGSL